MTTPPDDSLEPEQSVGGSVAARTSALGRALTALTKTRVSLRINHNTHTLATVSPPKRAGEPWKFNLHAMFLDADEIVLQALVAWGKNDDAAGRAVRKYIDAHMHAVRPKKSRMAGVVLSPRGNTHDLHALMQSVNEEFFGGGRSVYITWGQDGRRATPARRSRTRQIRFGSYDEHAKVIRIHPALDRPEVPEFFIRFVIYHEMLHDLLDLETNEATGRRRIHPPEFREMERLFPQYHEAIAFEHRFLKEFM
jgi:hypothetical protein